MVKASHEYYIFYCNTMFGAKMLRQVFTKVDLYISLVKTHFFFYNLIDKPDIASNVIQCLYHKQVHWHLMENYFIGSIFLFQITKKKVLNTDESG